MKSSLNFLMLLVAPVFVGIAQDPDLKTILENPRVLVTRRTQRPGAKVPMFSHPDRVLYIENGGVLRFTYPDGRNVTREVKSGDTLWSPEGAISSENIGQTEVRTVHVELKENDPAKSESAATELRAAFVELRHAMTTNDFAALNRLWADNYVMVGENGISTDKPQRIARLKSGQFKYVTIEHTDINVRVRGDVGFLTWAAAGKVLRNGEQQEMPYTKCSGLWSKKSGQWQSEFVQCTVSSR